MDLSSLTTSTDALAVNSHVDVSRRLHTLAQLQGEIDQLKKDRQQHLDFFDEEIQKRQQNFDYLASFIESYQRTTGEKTIKLPRGTTQFVTRKTKRWADEHDLIMFSREYNVETKVTEKPVKRAIEDACTRHGIPPQARPYEEDEETRFYVRFPKEAEAVGQPLDDPETLPDFLS